MRVGVFDYILFFGSTGVFIYFFFFVGFHCEYTIVNLPNNTTLHLPGIIIYSAVIPLAALISTIWFLLIVFGEDVSPLRDMDLKYRLKQVWYNAVEQEKKRWHDWRKIKF